MYRYKLTLAYDGTDYYGWQWQPDKRTIDTVLRATIKRVFRQKQIYCVAASRTDAGVHAIGQVVRIQMNLLLDVDKMKWVLNNALPSDIRIQSIKQCDKEFHPQHKVQLKTYVYTLFLEGPSIFEQRFGWDVSSKRLPLLKLEKALKYFEGTHDFSYFATSLADADPLKTIESISTQHEQGKLKIEIKGTSFLHTMIRRIVGAALTVALEGDMPVSYIKDMLEKKAVYQKLMYTAPAKGLCLKSIRYKKD